MIGDIETYNYTDADSRKSRTQPLVGRTDRAHAQCTEILFECVIA